MQQIYQWEEAFITYIFIIYKCHFLFKCSLYNDLRNDWIRNITDKTPDFVEMDTSAKFKVIFAIHHRITAKFILKSYNVRKENLFR